MCKTAGSARVLFRHYLDSGGNFVNTADGYADGRSEELLGTFVEETNSRDRVVLATKFTGAIEPGNPNATGNGRKNLLSSLNASLCRLRTDYVGPPELYQPYILFDPDVVGAIATPGFEVRGFS
ncbi:aldo/keto reductase [Jiangella gansuensis]|uniref:aldo/keto reductase n=1 Tax=Jiangella gansuensis TaxID=281473 RepID=UPI00047C8F40|nr:aldo/keto reductase [Jiangella gansuensis]